MGYLKHMELTNAVKLMYFEIQFFSYLLIGDLISKIVWTAVLKE